MTQLLKEPLRGEGFVLAHGSEGLEGFLVTEGLPILEHLGQGSRVAARRKYHIQSPPLQPTSGASPQFQEFYKLLKWGQKGD